MTEKKIDPMVVQNLLEQYNLDFYVKKEPLTLPDGTESGYFGIVRQDTRETFAAAKDTYEIFQNNELAELVIRVAEKLDNAKTRGGTFNGGGQVYLQIERPAAKINNDTIKRYASAINSFDLSTALRWGSTNKTISCRNVFWAVYRGLQSSVRHTRNMRDAVDQSLRIIENIDAEDKSLIEKYMQFAETKVTQEQIVKVVKKLTTVDSTLTATEANKEYSTRALNKAQSLIESIGSEINSKGHTLWGLWSGVTHFSTHKAGADKNRDKSKALGSLYRADNEVFSMVTEMLYKS